MRWIKKLLRLKRQGVKPSIADPVLSEFNAEQSRIKKSGAIGAKTTGPFLEKMERAVAVGIAGEDRLPGIAAKDNVVESTRDMYVRFSCHGIDNTSVRLSAKVGSPIGFHMHGACAAHIRRG